MDRYCSSASIVYDQRDIERLKSSNSVSGWGFDRDKPIAMTNEFVNFSFGIDEFFSNLFVQDVQSQDNYITLDINPDEKASPKLLFNSLFQNIQHGQNQLMAAPQKKNVVHNLLTVKDDEAANQMKPELIQETKNSVLKVKNQQVLTKTRESQRKEKEREKVAIGLTKQIKVEKNISDDDEEDDSQLDQESEQFEMKAVQLKKKTSGKTGRKQKNQKIEKFDDSSDEQQKSSKGNGLPIKKRTKDVNNIHRQSQHKNVFQNFGGALKQFSLNYRVKEDIAIANLLSKKFFKDIESTNENFQKWVQDELPLSKKEDFIRAWNIEENQKNDIKDFQRLFKQISLTYFKEFAHDYVMTSPKIQKTEIHLKSINAFIAALEDPEQLIKFKPF